MARHRHAVNVREDGLAAVLGPLLRDSRVVAAVLVDVDSGMVLDAWSAVRDGAPDLELLGAQHAEVVRGSLALLRAWPRPDGPAAAEACEVVLGAEGGFRHLLRTVPDPHGDRLALAVVVNGPQRVLDRVSRRLRSVAVDALTAGPSMSRRPVLGAWRFAMPGPDVPATAGPGAGPGPSLAAPSPFGPFAGAPFPAGPVAPPVGPPLAPAPPVAVAPLPMAPAPMPPAPMPPVPQAPVPGPVRRSGGGRVELPGPRNGRPAPPAAVPPRVAPPEAPAPPAAVSPRVAPPEAADVRPVRPEPVSAPVRPADAGSGRAAGPAPAGARRPSPPAALPAPSRPAQPVADTAAGGPPGTA